MLPCSSHAGEGEGSGGGIIQLRRDRINADAVNASREENHSVVQQRRGVTETRGRRATGSAEGTGCGVIPLRRCNKTTATKTPGNENHSVVQQGRFVTCPCCNHAARKSEERCDSQRCRA